MSTDLWIGFAGMVATALMSWGAFQSKIKDMDKRCTKLEENAEKYVTLLHFQEAMAGVRETYRDLKLSVDKVLEILSERHNN